MLLMMLSKGFISEIGHLSLPIPSSLSTSILGIARNRRMCQRVPKPLRKMRKKVDCRAIHTNNTLGAQMIQNILVSILHSGAMSWRKHKNCGDLGWHVSAASRKETSRSLWTWPCSALAMHCRNIMQAGTKWRMVGIHHSSLDL
jgi:hypothetical protein